MAPRRCSTADRFLGEAQALNKRARAHAVQTELQLYPVDAHGFHLFWSFLPEAAEALDAAVGSCARPPGGTIVNVLAHMGGT